MLKLIDYTKGETFKMGGAKYLFVAYSEADYEEIDNVLLELYAEGENAEY